MRIALISDDNAELNSYEIGSVDKLLQLSAEEIAEVFVKLLLSESTTEE